MATEKVKFIWKDESGKVVDTFSSKVTTALFKKMQQGTRLKLFIDEGKGFGEQFTGDYITNGLPDQPTPPPQPDNQAPKVNAGEDVTRKPGDTVLMDGSAVDTDGTIDRVEWHQISGLPSVQLVTDQADATNVSFVAPEIPAGEQSLVLQFALQAFDDKGKSAMDQIKVTITPDGNPPSGGGGGETPTPPGTIWQDKWGNQHARKIVGVAVDPDDKQFEMRAGASVDGRKELVIDGQGKAVCTGERYRAYIWNKPNAGSQGGSE